ncbi:MULTISPECIES: hypothetical protein [Legionella]|uniref:Uncharacterized protein n=1 Tax=Legionella drozanskii LLAP-1 TaxID=1212489 RepID=A0A0W0TC18_9GAMM|nr:MULTISPECIES: hypothetical protein [Legionella]KTC93151.1 hypothetical protein Ldro_0522 [Legionella drozanskii LLAP-1]PJE09346.1 MAG: hypothetical protein CK430_11175 [Legionella sp.]
MQDKRDGSLLPEVQEWEDKLKYIIAQCDLMAQRGKVSKEKEQKLKRVDFQGIVREKVSELETNLGQAKQEVKDRIWEVVEDKMVEKVQDIVVGRITDTLFSPIEEFTGVLDGRIKATQNGLETLTSILDTQDKGIFERTMENTTKFIYGQKRSVVQMYEQLRETGSIRTNFQQLKTSIPEAKENAHSFLSHPSQEKLDSTLTSVNNTASFFVRYLDDKSEETLDVLEEGERTFEKSIEKSGGVIKYSQSLVEKADRALEREAHKIERLDNLYCFYQNVKEQVRAAFTCVSAEDDELEVVPSSQ